MGQPRKGCPFCSVWKENGMLGVMVNTLGILLGGALGLALKAGIPPSISGAVMGAVGLSTIYLGISGALEGMDAIGAILALVLGAAIGTALDIDGALTRLGHRLEKQLSRKGTGTNLAQGFVAASLLFCVGSMAIVGSLNAGLKGDHSMLLAKSVLDTISAAMLAGHPGRRGTAVRPAGAALPGRHRTAGRPHQPPDEPPGHCPDGLRGGHLDHGAGL